MVGKILTCINEAMKDDPSHIDQILDMDLLDMLQIGLASEKYEPKAYAIKVIGMLMSGTDMVSMQIYNKMPDIHIMLVNNILTISLDHDTLGVTKDSPILLENKLLLKEGLWALSNIAACPPIVNSNLLDEDIIDRVLEVA